MRPQPFFHRFLVILATLTTLAGCSSPQKTAERPDSAAQAPYNRAMIEWLNNAAIDNAILSQHTLHPYHFLAHSAELNDLGRRDLAVLANHYRRNWGVVNVRRADTPDALYEARLVTVATFCLELGVPPERIDIADGIPGGDGMYAERSVRIQEAAASRSARGGAAPL